MPKRLTAAFVKHAAPGRYYDEHGLILRAKPTGSKQWIWRGTVRGHRVDLGLGGYPYTTLAEARQAAFEYKKLARAGGDPRALKTTAPTFEDALEKVLEIHREAWRPGSKSEAQWRASLKTHAFRRIGRKRVDQVNTADVMAVLLPIWSTKRETARRVRQRIGAVMKWAVAQGYREDNPAGDAIGAALPKNGGKVKHFRALPHQEVQAAMETVEASDAWIGTKLAFRFLTLTATRSGETRLAKWTEIAGNTWTIPGGRTKSGRPHRVPLAPAALQVLSEARQIADGSGLIFPSLTGRPLSAMTLTKLLRENGVQAVPHGFRTSFRVWCGDTAVAPEVAERALAHAIRDKVQAAYDRGSLYARRVRVMADWAAYCTE